MGMFSIRPATVVFLAALAAFAASFAASARAQPSRDVVIDVKGPNRTAYPIAVPASQ